MARSTHCVLLVLSVAAWGCDGDLSSRLPGHAGTSAPEFPEPAPSRRTTSEPIARSNLAASIEASRRKLRLGLDFTNASTLIEALMLRADLYGSYDDWEEASTVSTQLVEAQPSNPSALLLHASVLQTLHEFDAALALVSEARIQDPNGAGIGARADLEAQANHLEAMALLALGAPLDDLVARRRAMASERPTFQNLTSLALALAKLDRFTEADAAFRAALERYRDVSPFPFAWVAFQRGVMWAEQAGRPDLGRPLYEEALEYLPGHILANVHLAELDASDGRVDAAIRRMQKLGETQNPEPLQLLAAIVPSVEAANRYAYRAKMAYESLIERFPAAFEHHLSSDF
ncbi:MAG: hypothetical protein KJN97_11340 [Deltaproteobacteria bacterium]|nr:hypothetical protein [Deltaproteobacteria bacterium]